MFEIVVVGADDSETAKRAVEVATDIAAMYGSALHIVTAFEKGERKADVGPELTRPHRGERQGPPPIALLHRDEAGPRTDTARNTW